MAGLSILKHTHNLSDEELCARWGENPDFQLFCGEEFFLSLAFRVREQRQNQRGRKVYSLHAPEVERQAPATAPFFTGECKNFCGRSRKIRFFTAQFETELIGVLSALLLTPCLPTHQL
jgi:hypothetical protein